MITYTGKVCNKHPELLGERRKDNRRCLGCCRDNSAQWRKNNPEKARQHNALYPVRWAEANPEKHRENATKRMADWRKRNIEKVKARANSPEARAYRAARRALCRRATPAWADSFLISEVYHLAELRTKVVGVQYEVDHIVPLKHRLVSGLHTLANLRVITAKENASKGNRHWPDMP